MRRLVSTLFFALLLSCIGCGSNDNEATADSEATNDQQPVVDALSDLAAGEIISQDLTADRSRDLGPPDLSDQTTSPEDLSPHSDDLDPPDDVETYGDLDAMVFIDADSEPADAEEEIADAVAPPTTPIPIATVLSHAARVAAEMETRRQLPAPFVIDGLIKVNAAQYLFVLASALDTILQQGSGDVPLPLTLVDPIEPYPAVTFDDLKLTTPWEPAALPKLLGQLIAKLPASGNAPGSFTLDGNPVRFVEALYYLAHAARVYQEFARWPVLEKSIIAPRGLFPWTTPAGYEEYTSVLTIVSATPFFADHSRFYYALPGHRPESFVLARSIVSGKTNAFDAGKAIYDEVNKLWLQTIKYSSGTAQFENLGGANVYEIARHFFYTSGGPRNPMSLLARTVGIPSSPSGAVWFAGKGWVNMENHRPFGSDLSQNTFYYDDLNNPATRNAPAPDAKHDVIVANKKMIARVGPSVGGVRALFINPRDVLDHGAALVVERAKLGGFNTLILSVKSPRGYLYFTTANVAPERIKGDALTPLITAAHKAGLKVWAGFSSLADRLSADANTGWTQRLNSTLSGSISYPNYQISPCVAAYRTYLNSQVANLATNHAIDGLVLTHHYFANVFGNDDTTGHADCPDTPANWPSAQLTSLAQQLFSTARTARPTLQRVVSLFPIGVENRYFGYAPAQIGHQNVAALQKVADRLLLVVLGNYWSPKAKPWWIDGVSDLKSASGQDPLVSFYLTDEWTFPPSYYSGLARWLGAQDASGIVFHTALSGFGELSPALRKAQWFRVSQIEFE